MDTRLRMKTYIFHSFNYDYINEAICNDHLTFATRPAPVTPQLPNLKQVSGNLVKVIRPQFLQYGSVNTWGSKMDPPGGESIRFSNSAIEKIQKPWSA